MSLVTVQFVQSCAIDNTAHEVGTRHEFPQEFADALVAEGNAEIVDPNDEPSTDVAELQAQLRDAQAKADAETERADALQAIVDDAGKQQPAADVAEIPAEQPSDYEQLKALADAHDVKWQSVKKEIVWAELVKIRDAA